jgi:hypothetical protein
MRANSERLAPSQVVADYFSHPAHNQGMNLKTAVSSSRLASPSGEGNAKPPTRQLAISA